MLIFNRIFESVHLLFQLSTQIVGDQPRIRFEETFEEGFVRVRGRHLVAVSDEF
jgi:hypothetical protein